VKLTEISVRNLPAPPTGWKIHADDSLPGFGVRVTAAGVKAFVLTYGANRQRVTIGRYPIIGLADARVEAKRILAEHTLGKLRPKRMIFIDALDQFIETRKAKNRPNTAYQTERLLRLYFKSLHPLQLQDISAHHISDITDKLSKRKLQSAAAHAHTAVKTFLKWCSQRNYLAISPIAEMEKPGLPKSRERVLTDDELKAVWKAADKTEGHFGTIVKLLMLTGQRRSEVGCLSAGYVQGDTIALPATVTKNKRAHTIPIAPLSRMLLHPLSVPTPPADYMFPARGKPDTPFNGYSKSKATLDKEIQKGRDEPVPPWTLHDLRRTYATNLQRLGIKLEVIEALLNHVSGTRAGIVGTYQRHGFWDEMVKAVTAYEEWFARTITQA